MLLLLLFACRCGDPQSGPTDDVDNAPQDSGGEDSGFVDDDGPESPNDLESLDTEPNDTREDALAIPYGIADRVEVSEDDVDWFVLEAEQAGTLRVWAWDATGQLSVRADAGEGADLDAAEGSRLAMELEVEPGPVYLELQADDATDLQLALDFLPEAPVVTGLESETVEVGDTLVVTGENLGYTEDHVVVWIGAVPAMVTRVLPERIEATVPYGAVSGAVVVEVVGQRASTEPEVEVEHEAYPEVEPVDLDELPQDEEGVVEAALTVVMDPTAAYADLVAAADATGASWELLFWSSNLNTYEIFFTDDPDEVELEARSELMAAASGVDSVGTVQLISEEAGLDLDSDPFLDSLAGGSIQDGWTLYAGTQLAGAVDAQRLFNALASEAYDPVRIGVSDMGVWRHGVTGGPASFQFEQYDDTTPGVRVWEWSPANTAWEEDPDPTIWDPHSGSDHGTMVTGVFAAVSDGTPGQGEASGLLAGFHAQGVDDDGDGSVDEAGESVPFQVDSYINHTSFARWNQRLVEAARQDYDVFNISYGWDHVPSASGWVRGRAFRVGNGTLWFLSAGNDGVDAATHWPGGAQSRRNIATVGAAGAYTTVVGSHTVTADTRDHWSTSRSSNHGPTLTLVAPDRIASPGLQSAGTHAVGFKEFDGTSCASPHAASLGAMLRYLRPDLSPRTVRDLMVTTGTDITARDSSWNTDVQRIHWLRAMTAPMFVDRWADVDWSPYSWVAEQDADATLWSIELDPATGLTDGTAFYQAIWEDCSDPAELLLSHDGLRIAALCTDSDTVVIATTETGAVISETYIGGDIGVRPRAWVSPEGFLMATWQLSGQVYLSAWDMVSGEEVWSDVISSAGAYDLDVSETSWDAQQLVVLTSGNDAGELHLFDAHPELHSWSQDLLYDGDLVGDYPYAQVPRALALDPDGGRLSLVFSGNSTDEELLDIPVDSTGTPTPTADMAGFVRMTDAGPLERPYDLAYWPNRPDGYGTMLLVPLWESGRLALLEDYSDESYPDRWNTVATWVIADDANPEKVDFLQNGAGAYMVSASEETWSQLAFDPFASGVDNSFANTYTGFNGIAGLDTSPLVSFVHPRPGAHRAGLLEAVVLVRDDRAVAVTCTLGTTEAEVREATPRAGFWTCPALDLDGLSADDALWAEVETEGGETYSTRILLRPH